MTPPASAAATPSTSRARLAFAWLVLFAAYEAPEGVGGRLLGSATVAAVLMTLFHAVAWGVGRGLGYRNGFRAYALEWRGRALGPALALMLVLKPLSIFVGGALGVLRVQSLEKAPTAGALVLGVLGVAVSTFVPSLAEDIVARGFWFRAWPVAGKGWGYVLLCAVTFELTHVYRLGNGPREWLMLFCTGLAFAAAAARTGSLWGAVGLHWGWNLANGLMDLVLDVNPVGTDGPLLSAATGLVALALVVLLPRGPREETPAPPESAAGI
ncbi:CPBP family intramembrane metalloprotease [Pyxidicoccus parkwayensis]|uniref:CPBP family intramembrane metalloprotease n=1 Tax=Pyxidicoccus parkwayensis TaxID=2813578 RepID=A0ABX7NT26_9BACT|nr:type II CAAX endopeptidase family protein [Pyxidicoccus parkwaysis]QSQ22050.1 CPBP family intramembrane metalloprotease [Pyxidicoccus parkwaysis]